MTLCEGRLGFARIGTGTKVVQAYAPSPLKLLTPRNHGTAAWVYTSNLGGGFVDGDDVRLNVAVGEHSKGVLTSQGASRAYRSSRGSGSSLTATVNNGALFVFVPDPLMCFQGARYRQAFDLRLDTGASLIFTDTLVAGRIACNERWAFDSYESALHIERAGRTLVDEKVMLPQKHGAVVERFGRFNALATVVFLGPMLAAHAHRVLEGVGKMPVVPGADCVVSMSPLGEDGGILRVAGTSSESVASFVRGAVDFLPQLLGDNPFVRRW